MTSGSAAQADEARLEHLGQIEDLFDEYAPEFDEQGAADYVCEFDFKDFVELITGGHLEALVVQDISPSTWFHNKPRSTQCDIVCR